MAVPVVQLKPANVEPIVGESRVVVFLRVGPAETDKCAISRTDMEIQMDQNPNNSACATAMARVNCCAWPLLKFMTVQFRKPTWECATSKTNMVN